MKTGRVATKVAVAAVLMSLALSAQAPSDKDLTFKARSDLVLVPVMVNNHSGAHISNLKKEDFTVRENGVEQKIAVFEEVVTAAKPLRRVRETTTEFSNFLQDEPKPSRLTIIVLDGINTPFTDQVRARQELIKSLSESLRSGEPVALLSLTRGGVKVIHDFATDPRVLAAALKKARSGQPNITQADLDALDQAFADEEDAQQAQQAYQSEAATIAAFVREAQQDMLNFQRRVAIIQTLEGMQQIAQAFAGIPGRKAMVWATAGFPFTVSGANMALDGFQKEGLADVLPLYERTWQLLNDANIALYPLDVRGLVNPYYISSAIRGPSRILISRQMALHNDIIAAFQVFAEATGGRAFYNRNDLDKCFEDAAQDSASYYMLGYYLDKTNTKPGWRKLDVKVSAPHAEVRARKGFFVTEAQQDSARTKQVDINRALSSPLEYTGLPVVVKVTEVQPSGDKQKVTLTIGIPATPGLVNELDNNHLTMEFVTAATDAQGKTAGGFSNNVEGHLKPATLADMKENGITFTGFLELPPGEYTLHVVVRENLGGRLGSVSGPLVVK
jgi:VWFA-related protein